MFLALHLTVMLLLLFCLLQSGGGMTSGDDIKNEREYLLEIENDNEVLKANLQVPSSSGQHLCHQQSCNLPLFFGSIDDISIPRSRSRRMSWTI